MEKFVTTYDSLSSIYQDIESIMGSIYQDIELDSSNQKNANLLQGLGSVALRILSFQRNFVENYGDEEAKHFLLPYIDSKTTSLTNALSQTDNKRSK